MNKNNYIFFLLIASLTQVSQPSAGEAFLRDRINKSLERTKTIEAFLSLIPFARKLVAEIPSRDEQISVARDIFGLGYIVKSEERLKLSGDAGPNDASMETRTLHSARTIKCRLPFTEWRTISPPGAFGRDYKTGDVSLPLNEVFDSFQQCLENRLEEEDDLQKRTEGYIEALDKYEPETDRIMKKSRS